MEIITSLISTYGTLGLIGIILIAIAAIKGGLSLYKEIRGWLDSYYEAKKNKVESADRMNERIEKLEQSDEVHTEEMKELKIIIEETRKAIENLKESQNEVNRVQAKSSMYRLANGLIKKGWMTQTENDTLNDLSRIFIMSGKANYVVPPIVHKAMALEVLTDEEVEMKIKEQQKKL